MATATCVAVPERREGLMKSRMNQGNIASTAFAQVDRMRSPSEPAKVVARGSQSCRSSGTTERQLSNPRFAPLRKPNPTLASALKVARRMLAHEERSSHVEVLFAELSSSKSAAALSSSRQISMFPSTAARRRGTCSDMVVTTTVLACGAAAGALASTSCSAEESSVTLTEIQEAMRSSLMPMSLMLAIQAPPRRAQGNGDTDSVSLRPASPSFREDG
eukprot:897787-Rhodomonas_salina.3